VPSMRESKGEYPIGWLGGVVVARWTQAPGSTPGQCTARQQLWASC